MTLEIPNIFSQTSSLEIVLLLFSSSLALPPSERKRECTNADIWLTYNVLKLWVYNSSKVCNKSAANLQSIVKFCYLQQYSFLIWGCLRLNVRKAHDLSISIRESYFSKYTHKSKVKTSKCPRCGEDKIVMFKNRLFAHIEILLWHKSELATTSTEVAKNIWIFVNLEVSFRHENS
jgi:hypothetical protein